MSRAEQAYDCGACSSGDGDEATDGTILATVYCVECQQRLCRACEEDHKKFKVTRRHKTVELTAGYAWTRPESATCEKHSDRHPEIYCFDCDLAICTVCCISGHNKHILGYIFPYYAAVDFIPQLFRFSVAYLPKIGWESSVPKITYFVSSGTVTVNVTCPDWFCHACR